MHPPFGENFAMLSGIPPTVFIQPTQQLRVVSSWFGSIFVFYFCFSVEALLTLIEADGLSLSLHRTSHRTRTETVSRSGTDELLMLHACVSCRTEVVLLSVQVRILRLVHWGVQWD